MGQLVIEVPRNVNRFFLVKDSEFGEKLLQNLEDFDIQTKSGESPAVIPPRRARLKEDLAKAVGIWADREESAEEIARRIREANREIT